MTLKNHEKSEEELTCCFKIEVRNMNGHPRYFKFKRKYQQYGPCFQTIFPFFMTVLTCHFHILKVFLKSSQNQWISDDFGGNRNKGIFIKLT